MIVYSRQTPHTQQGAEAYQVGCAPSAGTKLFGGIFVRMSFKPWVKHGVACNTDATYRYRDVSSRLCRLWRSQRMQQSSTAQLSGRGGGVNGSIGSLCRNILKARIIDTTARHTWRQSLTGCGLGSQNTRMISFVSTRASKIFSAILAYATAREDVDVACVSK
jgi:hypothetical protein